jgi:hypothetical protein
VHRFATFIRKNETARAVCNNHEKLENAKTDMPSAWTHLINGSRIFGVRQNLNGLHSLINPVTVTTTSTMASSDVINDNLASETIINAYASDLLKGVHEYRDVRYIREEEHAACSFISLGYIMSHYTVS